jgi:hypothetical protein
MQHQYYDPHTPEDSVDLLIELLMGNSHLDEQQARKIVRAWLSFADILMDDD